MTGAAIYHAFAHRPRAWALRLDLGAARLLGAGLLMLLCAMQLFCVLRAPAAWMPARVTVALDPGREMALDGAALGLPQADGAHIRLRRDAGGAWWVADAGAGRLQLRHGDAKRRAGSVLLAAGQRFQLGASRFGVDAVDGAAIAFARGAVRWRYDGATLLRDGLAQPDCPDTRLAARLVGGWNRLLPSSLGVPRPLVFGGNLDCGNRIAIAGVAAPGATVKRSPEGMLLSASPDAQAVPLLLHGGAADGGVLLAEREEALAGTAVLQLGRTALRVEQSGRSLKMQPLSHVALYREPRLRLPDDVSWSWARRDHWRLPQEGLFPLGAALALALALAVGMWLIVSGAARRLGRARTAGVAAAVLLAGAGAVLLYLQKSGAPAGAGLVMVTAWAALWCAWLAAGRSLGGSAGILLLALGLLAQLDMGLGAPDSAWLRHAGKAGALLAIGAGVCGLLAALRPVLSARPLPQARLELALLVLTGVALALLVLQVLFGDETGVFDLQPVEFAKLTLAALSAHSLALASGSQPVSGGALLRVLRLGAPALLFLVLLAVALVQVDDYSPLILLTVWGVAMALAFALAGRRYWLIGVCAAAFLAAVAGVALLRAAGPGEFARWNFYADRFMVWLDPGSHPHTGQQLLLGAEAIAGGGWFGADHALGLATLGQDAGAALRIPAVQDDFAPAFFLHRHGLAAALALWLLQTLFLAGLLRTALRCWIAAAAARDFRLAWRGRFRCFLLCGGAAFVCGHFLLSWGTNLAIFPVMGQPMSFLSAGGSHLLFFICPLLALCVASEHAARVQH